MDLAAICEVLKATQQTEPENRKAAEAKLHEAVANTPNELVVALQAVVAASSNVAVELRQEACVILRQLVTGAVTAEPVWKSIQKATKKGLQFQLLTSLESDPSTVARRSIGQVIVAIAEDEADDFDDVMQEWPELLPTVSRLVGVGNETSVRVVALGLLKDMSATVGSGLLEKGNCMATLGQTLQDPAPEVRAAGAQLMLDFIETLEQEVASKLAPAMPGLVAVLQGFANDSREEELKATLVDLSSAVEEEPEFFKEHCFQDLFTTLAKICSVPPEAFGDVEVRNSAMEALMSLAQGLSEEFSAPEGKQHLECLLTLNIQWMLEVEEDVELWTKEGKDTDDDDCDGEGVSIGEENLDRLAEVMTEKSFFPLLFKVIREMLARPDATWKHMRAGIMAISQSAEYIEDEMEWADTCADFVSGYFSNPHPRVRYAAFWSVAHGMSASDEVLVHVAEKHVEKLLPDIVRGISDDNIRVATAAVDAFSSLSDSFDFEDIEGCMRELLLSLFKRLEEGGSRALQESCLTGIASVATSAEEDFQQYYPDVMPLLKRIVANATAETEKTLRGKAIECVAMIGGVVGKAIFEKDAHDVLGVIGQLVQAGFAADDQMRESVNEAATKMAGILGKDFKPYMSNHLPSIFHTLAHRPRELSIEELPDDDDDDDETKLTYDMIGDKIMGLRTSQLDEMDEALEMLREFIDALEEGFCEFLPTTCQALLPLLEITLSENLRKATFKTYEKLVVCARAGVNKQVIDISALQELVSLFLKQTVQGMAQAPVTELGIAACSKLEAQSVGVAGIMEKAGEGVVSKEAVRDIAAVTLQLLASIKIDEEDSSKGSAGRRKKKGAPAAIEDDEDEDEKVDDDDDVECTPQSARFALVDVMCALMRACRDDFAEVALQSLMEFVRAKITPEANEFDRSLAFYIAGEAIDCVGERSVPYWNWFLNQSLAAVLDKSAVVRQHATMTIGNAAEHASFAPMAAAAASQVYNVLQKHGERHRRRRANKSDALQTAYAVDACIKAMGQIAEYQEQQLGPHAGTAWSMWLSSLPLKYDEEAGQKSHAQFLRLVARGHPSMVAPESQSKVVEVLAGIWKTKFSNKELDQNIATVVAAIGEATLETLCQQMPEIKKRKVELIVKAAKQAGA